MARHEVRTSEGLVLHVELAGPASRAAAATIDALVVGGTLLALYVLAAALLGVDPTGVGGFVLGLLVGGAVVLFVAYLVVTHRLGAGQSPGKRLLGLRVVGADGQPARTGPIVLRSIVLVPEVALAAPLPLAFLVSALSPTRRRLGDLAADTVVVREPDAAGAREPWPRATWTDLVPRVLELGAADAPRWTSAEADLLRDVIQRTELPPRVRRPMLSRTARALLRRVGQAPEGDPRPALRELYLFLREHRAALS